MLMTCGGTVLIKILPDLISGRFFALSNPRVSSVSATLTEI